MKILYGVNGVGNGHITRSRIMANELALANHDVHYLFSGRDEAKYFDMEPFGTNVTFKKGLTFAINKGKVDILKTITNSDITTFLRDIDSVHLEGYDLVISDFEPISAWAAKIQQVYSIGIGHQYAFNYKIPKEKSNIILNTFMKWYAPVNKGIGLHWDNFGFDGILPPIVENLSPEPSIENKILVYLAFEDAPVILATLSQFTEYDFYVYGFDTNMVNIPNNIKLLPPSKDGFLADLKSCNGVICNAGFELISEALVLGKKILAKPVTNQMEQHSNKLALEVLGYGMTMNVIDSDIIKQFLTSNTSVTMPYTNVARNLVFDWLPYCKTTWPYRLY
jgi:uncharacterized protein (TIGR00661 family)